MLQHIHMAKSYQFQLQREMQVIASNIANCKTPGFKLQRVFMESTRPADFENVIQDLMQPGERDRKFKRYEEYGSPIRTVDVQRSFTSGPIEFTKRPLDLAITNGDGFFQLRLPDGRSAYTRAGNFRLDGEGYITDVNGTPLEPAIRVPDRTTEMTINKEGRIFVLQGSDVQPREIGQIQMVRFNDPARLRPRGQNMFLETRLSGEAIPFEPSQDPDGGQVQQGAVEISNVNIIEEMMEMLLCQRGFELCAGAQDSCDKLLKLAMETLGR